MAFVPFVLLLASFPPARAAVHAAQDAVEGDSVARVQARWETRARRDPHDRPAILGLATLAALTYEYARADSLYRSLLDDGIEDDVAAWAALAEGAAKHKQGDLTAAADWYARSRTAARASGDRAAAAWATFQSAVVRARVSGPAAGLALMDSARQFIPTGDPDVAALYHSDRAAILAQQADPRTRHEALTCASLAHRAMERRREAICLHLVAITYWTNGQSDSALAWLTRACALLERARDRATLAGARQWRGSVLKDAHDYGNARRELLAAVEDAQISHSADPLGWASTDLAAMSLSLGDFSAAEQEDSTALAVFPATRDAWGLAAARSVAASIAAEKGDTATARTQYRAVVDWAAQTHTPFELASAHNGLALVAMRENDWRTASDELDSCDAVVRRYGLGGFDAGLASHRTMIAMHQGALDRAQSTLDSAMASLGPTEHAWRYRIRALLADVAIRRGDAGQSARQLAAAEDELDAWRASLSDAELRVLVFQWREVPSEPEDGVARVIAGVARAGRVREALGLAERRRARELQDELVRASIVGSGHGTDERPITPAEAWGTQVIDQALPDDSTAIIEYVTGSGDEPSTIFAVTRRDLRAYLLPPADSLAADADRFTSLVESGADGRAAGKRVGTLLLGPALGAMPGSISRLVIVPDGALHRLPFDALVVGDQYVAERYTVSLAPSIGALALLRRRPVRARAPMILAFGDPRFGSETDRATSRDTYRSLRDATGELPRLPGSAREAALVARYAPASVVRLREEASEAYLKRTSLTPFTVIHFATHALVDEWAVTRTALALAPGQGEDGFVDPAELGALHLDADLVVLSACRTASGVIVGGEGVRGLAVPLMASGARAIVATGWQIGDQATVTFVRDFYSALATGADVAGALRRAKLAAIGRGRAPAEWAVFSAMGDPITHVRLVR